MSKEIEDKVIASFSVRCPGAMPEFARETSDAFIVVYESGNLQVGCPYVGANGYCFNEEAPATGLAECKLLNPVSRQEIEQ